MTEKERPTAKYGIARVPGHILHISLALFSTAMEGNRKRKGGMSVQQGGLSTVAK
jgi:hypothetical protein